MRKRFTLFLAFAMMLAVMFTFPCNAIAEDTSEFSGTYYFRNAYVSGSFIDVENGGNSETVKVHTLVKTRNQSWTVTPIGNGYYKIKSNYSGYYLTVVNNSTVYGASVVVTTYSGATGQQWLIYNEGQGIYSLKPKCNENGYLSAPLNSGSDGQLPTNGTTLGIYNKSQDSIPQESWYLHKMTDYTLIIDADYDDAYVSRYGTAKVASRIDDALLRLKRVMLQYAGVNVEFNYNYDNVDTYIDTSSCSVANSNYSSMCSCGNCINSTVNTLNTYHHTNCTNVLYRLTNTNQQHCIRVVFSGHDMCMINNLSHVSSTKAAGIHSIAWQDKDIILMFDFYTEVFDHERMIMIKNVLEFYGLSNHAGKSETGYNDNCIFGNNGHSSDIVEMCTLCDHCQELLRTNINRYNHFED